MTTFNPFSDDHALSASFHPGATSGATPPVPNNTSLIIGRSTYAIGLRSWALKWGSFKCPLSIYGRTGTGKSLLAEELHRGAGRSAPFVRVGIHQVEPTLLRSAFFGHVRSAFTGALRDKVGYVEAAAGGTLFIDDLQDAGPEAQALLLDVAERRPISRMGEHRPFLPTCRLVVGSQRPLFDLVAEGDFREDLAYRLSVESAHCLPLTDHLDDLDDLVATLVSSIAAAERIEPLPLRTDAVERLRAFGWPGNIRRSTMPSGGRFIDAQCDGEIAPHHLPSWLTGSCRTPTLRRPTPAELTALVDELGSIAAVAGRLDVVPRTVSRWLRSDH